MDKISKLINIINNSTNIVFFGGAGVSVESGIPDFRSSNGLYQQESEYPIEQILSHSFFINNTSSFYNFYKKNMIYLNAVPNFCHYALAALEKKGKLKAIITQNIDNLHQLAGSKNVLELHGTIYKNHCMSCHKSYDINTIVNSKDIPYCSFCNGIIKPDVVLYEEGLSMTTIEKSLQYISDCQTLIIGGTSLSVYPAAGLVQYYRGKELIIINKSPSSYDKYANLIINESIGKVFEKVIKEMD